MPTEGERRSGGCQETGGSDARAGEAVAMATAGGDVRGRAPQPPETASAPCRELATLLWPTGQEAEPARGPARPG